MREMLLAASLLASALSDAQSATNAPFSIQHHGRVDWLVKPNGEKFFSFGVCVVDQGASRADYNSTNPGYAAFQHYKDSNQWAEATLQRLRSWKFTTIGAWSDFETLKQRREADVAFTPMLAVGMTCGVPWVDMWDTNVIARMHEVARKQILPLRDDPRVLGYYSDNEMGWWNAPLFKMTLEQAPTSVQRQRLLQLLRQTYRNDWAELLKDFEAEGVGSFEELDRRGMLYLRAGGQGIRICRRFLALMAERYYSLVREIIRTYDERALILGDRYQSFYYSEVARACAPHVDAVSGNLNAAWSDGTFPRFYLDTLHALTGKPLLVSEFYMAARQNRSGNKNDQSLFPTVDTQKERVIGFRNTLMALARIPYVLGADWFQSYDEPTHGRDDGENFNFGLVDIYDRPYQQLTTAAAEPDLTSLKRRGTGARSDASQGVPRAPRNPLGHFEPLLALKDWDRERGLVEPVSKFPLADLYLCWNRKALYVGLYAQDVAEAAFYRDKTVPETDRAEWVISIGKTHKPIRARLGAGTKPDLSEPELRISSLFGAYFKTRTIAAIEIPARRLGREQLKPGDTIDLSSSFLSHCRADRVLWKGRFTLRDER